MRKTVFPVLVVASVQLLACQHIPPRPLSPARTAAALESRSLDDPALARFLIAARGGAPSAWPPHRWDLDALTLAALYFEPGLDVVRAHAEVARAAIETAGARPNPTLAVAPQLSANPMGAVSPWLTTVNLDWPIETAGKRGRRIERAERAAEAAREAIWADAWRVRRALASSLVARAAAERQRDSLRDEVAAQQRLVALVEGRERAGAAAAGDVAPFRFALLQATTDEAAAEAQVGEALVGVAAAIGVPAAALDGVTLPDGFDPAEADALSHLTSAEARRRAALERFDVRRALAEYAATEATLRLELARQYPDLRLGPSYEFDQGQNKWGVTLALDLPIVDRNQGPIAEAVAARGEAAAKLVATQAAALAEVEQAVARRDGAITRRARARAVAREREANLARARAAVRLGALDRVGELGAAVEQVRAARAAADAESALAQALVDLEAAVEGPLPAAALDAPPAIASIDDAPEAAASTDASEGAATNAGATPSQDTGATPLGGSVAAP